LQGGNMWCSGWVGHFTCLKVLWVISSRRESKRSRPGFLVIVLLQIFFWFSQWKNFENRLIFDQVIRRTKMVPILLCQLFWATLYVLMPTVNCLLGSPATASTFYTSSFLLSVNWITVFETVPIIINVLIVFLPSETDFFTRMLYSDLFH